MGKQTVSVLNMKKTDNDPRGTGQDSLVKSYVSVPWELWAGQQGPPGMGLCLCTGQALLGMRGQGRPGHGHSSSSAVRLAVHYLLHC